MYEAELSMLRRLGRDSEVCIFAVQGNLAIMYKRLGRLDESMRLRQDVYSGTLKLYGEEHRETLIAANNYASSLVNLKRFKEAKAVLRKSVPTARRILGENDRLTLKMRKIYARALYNDASATLEDLREAVTRLEELAPYARRVLGGAHPTTVDIEQALRHARAALRARETPASSA